MSEKTTTTLLFVTFMLCGAMSALLLLRQGLAVGVVALACGAVLGTYAMEQKTQ